MTSLSLFEGCRSAVAFGLEPLERLPSLGISPSLFMMPDCPKAIILTMERWPKILSGAFPSAGLDQRMSGGVIPSLGLDRGMSGGAFPSWGLDRETSGGAIPSWGLDRWM